MHDRDIDLTRANQQIDWVLHHPDMSAWVKSTLKAARRCDPLTLSNDLELLDCLLRVWCEAAMQTMAADAGCGCHG